MCLAPYSEIKNTYSTHNTKFVTKDDFHFAVSLNNNFLNIFVSKSQILHSIKSLSKLHIRFIKKQMEDFHVNMDFAIHKSEGSLPFSVVIVNSSNGNRTILHHELDYREPTFQDFAEMSLSRYSWIHFEGRNVAEVEKMIESVVDYNASHPTDSIKISFELEKSKRVGLEKLLPHAHVVIVGREFAEAKGCTSATEAVNFFKTITTPGTLIVCAWGAAGAASGIAGKENEVTMTPAVSPSQVVDTLGAGDTFLAGVVHALHSGNDVTTAVQFACALAGHKVGSLGYDCIRKFDRSKYSSAS